MLDYFLHLSLILFWHLIWIKRNVLCFEFELSAFHQKYRRKTKEKAKTLYHIIYFFSYEANNFVWVKLNVTKK